MRAFQAMLVTELKLASRNSIYMFFNFVFPPLMLSLFGAIYGNQPDPFYGGFGAVDVLTPSYMPMILAVAGIMGLPLQLAMYRHYKILKRFRATPIGAAAIMWPHLIINGLLCIGGIVLLIVVGRLAFQLNFMGDALEFAFALLVSIVSVFSLGFMIAAVAPNNRAATMIANLIYFPMLFISGSTIPRELLPQAVVTVSKIFPLTHCVTVLRGVWLGGALSSYRTELVLLAGFAAICMAVSIKVFRWE
jgi:ABC-2 type transport system permease protein